MQNVQNWQNVLKYVIKKTMLVQLVWAFILASRSELFLGNLWSTNRFWHLTSKGTMEQNLTTYCGHTELLFFRSCSTCWQITDTIMLLNVLWCYRWPLMHWNEGAAHLSLAKGDVDRIKVLLWFHSVTRTHDLFWNPSKVLSRRAVSLQIDQRQTMGIPTLAPHTPSPPPPRCSSELGSCPMFYSL